MISMRKYYVIVAVSCLSLFSIRAEAQRFSLSTNLLDYACLGTLNVEGSFSATQHLSLTAGVKYNPFTFGKADPERQMQLRQRSVSLGARIWPWHTWSGWWFAAKARLQEYNFGGILSRETREGNRFGAGLYTGYTHMLGANFNIEFGLGLWGGLDIYDRYSCQVCGLTLDSGRKGFLLPDDLMISLVYVF